MDKQIINNLSLKYEDTITNAKNDLLKIKTGKASPSLVENIIVETYNGSTKIKLKELASILIRDPKTLSIQPYDPATIQDIEKAIRLSPLQLSSRTENKMVYIIIPPLSDEQRNNYVKVIAAEIEKAKNKIRLLRDETRKQIKLNYENKDITQDDKYRIEKQIDDITKKYTDILDDLKQKKQADLLTM